MRNSIILLAFIIHSSILFSQERVIYRHCDFWVELNYSTMKYTIGESLPTLIVAGHISPISENIYSEGCFIRNKDRLICIDNEQKCKYIFKTQNKFDLKVLNGNHIFRDKLLFKASYFEFDDYNVIMSWKGNKKDGPWIYEFSNGTIKRIHYKDNVCIDSLSPDSIK